MYMYIYIYITRSGEASAPTDPAAGPGFAPRRGAAVQGAASGVLRRPPAPVRPSGGRGGGPRASPGRRGAPALQERDSLIELVRCEPVRLRVLDERDATTGKDPV